MYAIHQFKKLGVTPSIETLIVLLDAEEANRLLVVDMLDKAEGLARYYKRLTVLLALLMVLLSLLVVIGSVSLLSAYC